MLKIKISTDVKRVCGLYFHCGWRINPIMAVARTSNGMTHTSNRGVVYIQWKWCIHPMGVALKHNVPVLPMEQINSANCADGTVKVLG